MANYTADWKYSAVGILSFVLGAYFVIRGLYRILFHPLASFPGPKLAAISHLPYAKSLITGHLHWDIYRLHERYGPVVRLAPNTLSFATAKAAHEIYGSSKKRGHFTKNEFYDGVTYNGDNVKRARSLATERDPQKHAKLREIFEPSFSIRSLQKQERYVQKYLDMFLAQLKQHEGEPMEMYHWFTCLTWDLIGELSLGEDFCSTKTGNLHAWVRTIMSAMFYASAALDILRRYQNMKLLLALVRWLPLRFKKTTQSLSDFATGLIQKRIESKTDRDDFFTNVIGNGRSKLSFEQIRANAFAFIIAGSETTTNVLAAVTYFLTQHPEIYDRLAREVRTAFENGAEMNLKSTELPYLTAVIDESMRLLTPVPVGGWRTSPGAVVDGYYVPPNTEVSTSPWAISHSADYFRDPWKFKPERWLKTGYNVEVLAASKPFSSGPRACIGRYLAMLEIRLTLCRILFAFDFELDGKPETDMLREGRSWVLWEKHEYKLRFRSREIDDSKEKELTS